MLKIPAVSHNSTNNSHNFQHEHSVDLMDYFRSGVSGDTYDFLSKILGNRRQNVRQSERDNPFLHGYFL